MSESKARVITLRITPEQHQALKEEAAKSDLSMNQYCVDKCMSGINTNAENNNIQQNDLT